MSTAHGYMARALKSGDPPFFDSRFEVGLTMRFDESFSSSFGGAARRVFLLDPSLSPEPSSGPDEQVDLRRPHQGGVNHHVFFQSGRRREGEGHQPLHRVRLGSGLVEMT